MNRVDVEELKDQELEKIAGGKGGGTVGEETSRNNTYTCNDNRGIGTRISVNTSL
ncbi:MAG: hypothetical protein HQK78_14900 [Desulfobacterales bacterium]|nr:hypothetical protein [Desulfobacterales bacterium]